MADEAFFRHFNFGLKRHTFWAGPFSVELSGFNVRKIRFRWVSDWKE